MAVLAYVGLGSNLGDRRAMIDGALGRLRPARVSSVIETDPVGRTDQPRFLNAVAELETALPPAELLELLLGIERDSGRVRSERWGPRTLDLDLLLYGDLELRTRALAIPHPELHRRRFVLEGLSELCPGRAVPGLGRTIRDLLDALPEPCTGGAR